MSTINRIEVANFLNLNGEGESEPWEPRYRALMLNFRGQSTALNMTNGVGKTSNVEAWLALLTRDPTLISRSREKMAPERDGYYSHVRIELLMPAAGSVATDDFFVMQGGPAPGRETWVFGMYGYRSAGSVYFYYYRGGLEQVPVADYGAEAVALLPNRSFRDALKAAPGSRHNPVREDWIAELSLHVSPVSMRRQAEYQKRGGGDKSAELFALKSRPGERYDVTFFYEVIAPELLSGLMDREGEEGEHEFEDTVLNAVMDVIRTRHNTQRKKTELEKVEQVLGLLDAAAGKATAAEQAQADFVAQRGRMLRDVALLTDLVRERPLPGIPAVQDGTEHLGRLQEQLVIEPGSRDYRLLDAGIVALTGESVTALNQRARRSDCAGRKLAGTLVVPGRNAVSGKNGARPTAYRPRDARELVESSSQWAEGLTRRTALELLDDLESWFLNHEAHRNPYRTRRNKLEYEIEQAGRNLEGMQQSRRSGELELAGLRDQKTRMEADEAAYRDVQACGLFTPEELEQPGGMVAQVAEEYRRADAARWEFLEQKGRVEVQRPQWERFLRRFPDADDPLSLHQRHEEQEQSARVALEEVRGQKAQAETEGRTLGEKAGAAEGAVGRQRELVGRFARLEPALVIYAREFGEESLAGLESRVMEEKARAEAEIRSTRERLPALQAMVDELTRFRRESDGATPADWLAARERERSELLLRKPELERQRQELERRRRELDREQVAAAPAARQALEYLEQRGIDHVPLHRAVAVMGLDDGRRRALLSCFSALLFAPVAPSRKTALAAAACLAVYDAQVPVLMADALESFARHGDLEADRERDFYHGLIAGVTTRAVACLLDPELVEGEKTRLDGLIAESAREAGRVESQLRATAEDASLTRLARQAQAALEADAGPALESRRRQLRELTEILPTLRRRVSEESLQAIRAAGEFAGLGGAEQRDAAARDLEEGERLLAELWVRRERLQNRLQALGQEEREAQGRLEDAYPAKLRTLLEQAQQFVAEGGVAFLASLPEREQALGADVEQADRRKEYRHQLERAALFLTARQREAAGEDINGLIARKEAELKQAGDAMTRLQRERGELQARRRPLEQAMEALDQAALRAQTHYRPAAGVAEALVATELDSGPLADNEIFQQAELLRRAVERGDEPAAVVREAEALTDLLGQLEIERDLETLNGLERLSRATLEAFLVSVQGAAGYAGLSDVERERLQGVRDLAGAQRVAAMARDIREIFEREHTLYQQAAAAEGESRDLVTKRIGYFVDSARDNLDLFRRVAREPQGGERAHFKVSADMISRQESVALIENIIATLDEEEAARAKRRKRGMEVTESDHQYRTRLRDLIRQSTYRRIFKSPAVKYVSPHIRQDERPRPLTRSLSSGQLTAMTLQWIIRLAEYAISREMQGSITRVSMRRRARERAQSILFIDGLFSDLSDEQLIREAMSGIRNTRGRFQLIGLIHNVKYTNDFDVFPVLLVGRMMTGRQGVGGWVGIDEQSGHPEETVQVAEIRRETRPEPAES